MGRRPTVHANLPKGMRARKQRSGNVYYYYDTGAKPRKEIPLGDDYVQAVRKWAELEHEQSSRFADLVTFKYAADRYVREVLPTKASRTQRDNLIELEFLLEFFNNPPAPLDQIEAVHIRQYMDWRVKKARDLMLAKNSDRAERGLAPLKLTGKEGQVRANREKALFSHIFNMARNWGLTNASNPCSGIKGYTETGRDVYVDDVLYKAVWDAADTALRNALDLAYLTGQRPADVLKLSLTDIKDGELMIQQNKTGKRLRVAIEGELASLIERIRNTAMDDDAPLISAENGRRMTAYMLRGAFDRARMLASKNHPELMEQIKAYQFRDLRAKAGTDKEENEGMQAAQDQLGHTTSGMTAHYVRHRRGKLVKPTK